MITEDQINLDIIAYSAGENSDVKKSLAEQAMSHGMNWVKEQPKGWNQGSLSRPEVRKQKREQRRALRKHIEDNMIEPKGFIIPTFIFIALLSGVISWVVNKILNEYFD